MDTVNSRYLTSQNGFLQLFPSPDEFAYYLTTTPEGITTSHESAFRLTVKAGKARKGNGSQHDVKVNWDGRCYVPTPAELKIEANDYVMWHCEQMAGSPPFAVRGQGKKSSFSSSALGPNAAFTHFFLTPGEVKYQVNGKGNYTIHVTDHRQVEKSEYDRRTAQLPIIQIQDGKATPAKLDVVAGQSVIWTVENDEGVTIVSGR
jgi:plastocyanin